MTPLVCRDYITLPQPLEAAAVALADPALWAELPTGARRCGALWQWGRDLFAVQCTPLQLPGATPGPAWQPPQPLQIQWQITSPALPGVRLDVHAALYDATVSTHAQIEVRLQDSRLRWPWQRWQAVRQLRAVLRRCGALLADQCPYEPPDLSRLPDDIDAAQLTDALRERFPQTVAHFTAMGADEHLARVWRLERGWQRVMSSGAHTAVHETGGAAAATPDYDLIYAGGGLGLLHAAVMAQCYGWRVLLFDRGTVGSVHREWNISRRELEALVGTGVVTWAELAPIIMREYRNGLVSFYSGPHSSLPHADIWLPEVLNVALDAGALLRLMRHKLEAAGGTVLDGRLFQRVQASAGSPLRVAVELTVLATGAQETHTARLLLDGMGSTSPLALLRHAGRPFAGVCPTVGTVVRGVEPGSARNQFDPTLGDILVSISDTQRGRQMIWEGFPGRGDELTVYLFYYAALAGAPQPPGTTLVPPTFSLLELFELYFALLPDYKQPGPDFAHLKPVYGYIPGRHSVQAQEAPLLRGVLPIGDSAAQQSPLTFCGFGSHVRNLPRTTSLLTYALQHNLTAPHHLRRLSAYQANVSLNWVFSRFMQPWQRSDDVNALQNAFLAALHDLGDELATRFFQDRMRWQDYNQIIWQTMLHYPAVFLIVWHALGVKGVRHWIADYARFSAEAALAGAGNAAGERPEAALLWLLDRLAPAASLALRARAAEWRAMGWR